MLSFVEHAHRYAEKGWRVIPVNKKKPAIGDWVCKATTDRATIERWSARFKNIGIVTGKASGVVVIDVDPRNNGEKTLADLERSLGALPATVEAITGGGGSHLVFQWFEGATSQSQSGIDFLAEGKMFVVSPSVHPDTERRYEWKHSPLTHELAVLPLSWREHFCKRLESFKEDQAQKIPEGQRNDALASIAADLFAKGRTLTQVEIHLNEENLLRCCPPLPEQEVLSITRSMSRYKNSGKSLKTRWQELIADTSMDKIQKLVLSMLALDADEHGRNCFPTQERVAERAGCSRKTAGKWLRESECQGFIRSFTHRRNAGPGYSTSYHLLLKDE